MQNQNEIVFENDEIDLTRIFKQFRAHIKGIAVIMVIVLLIGYGYAATRTTVYASSSTMAVMYTGETNESSAGKYNFSANLVDTFVLFTSENIVLDKVSEITGYSTSELKSGLSIASENLIIKLSYKDTNRNNAQKILNCIMDTAIDIADSTTEDGSPKYAMLSGSLYVFSKASTARPISNTIRIMAVAFALGLLLSCVYVLIWWISDRRFKDSFEIEEELGLPVFAAIPFYNFEERKRKK